MAPVRHIPAPIPKSKNFNKTPTLGVSTRSSVGQLPMPWVSPLQLQDVRGCEVIIDEKNLEATDTKTGRIYLYAPRRSNESRNCDLFVLDTNTMELKDLSDNLEHDVTDSPHESSHSEKMRKFPMLDYPSFAFMNDSALVLFGGTKYFKEDQSDARSSSDLYLIFVEDHSRPRWGRFLVQGTAGKPRNDATIAVVGNKIYLFGGVDKPHDPGEKPGNLMRSYSIIECDREVGSFKWLVTDAPYPNDLPPNISFGRATPVSNGKRILLMPGRTAGTDYQADITSNNVFYFYTKTRRFIKAKVLNDGHLRLPKALSSYHTAAFIPPPNKYTLVADKEQSSVLRRPPPQNLRLLYPTVSSPESVLLCGWKISDKYAKPIPELWRIVLYPTARIMFMPIDATEDLMKIPAEFHYFTIIHDKICLLGSEEEEDFNKEDLAATMPLLDACLEIPLKPLKEFEI